MFICLIITTDWFQIFDFLENQNFPKKIQAELSCDSTCDTLASKSGHPVTTPQSGNPVAISGHTVATPQSGNPVVAPQSGDLSATQQKSSGNPVTKSG